MIRTVFYENGAWWMLCGQQRVRVELRDGNNEPVQPPAQTVEETNDDERITDLQPV